MYAFIPSMLARRKTSVSHVVRAMDVHDVTQALNVESIKAANVFPTQKPCFGRVEEVRYYYRHVHRVLRR